MELDLARNVFYDQACQAYLSFRLLLSTNYLASGGMYYAHLCIECLLKAIIADRGSGVRGHDLLNLHSKLISLDDDPALKDDWLIRLLDEVNPYQQLGRYGAMADPSHEPDRIDEGELKVFGVVAIQPSAEVLRIDHAFMLLRSKVVASVDMDAISLILDHESGTLPLDSWNLPPPLSAKEVLLSGNSFLPSST